MSPRDILTKHISRIRDVRIPDVRRHIDAAMKDLADHDYIIIERTDLLKEPELLRALYCNRAKQNTDHS